MTIVTLRSVKLKVNLTEFHLHQKETICLRILTTVNGVSPKGL